MTLPYWSVVSSSFSMTRGPASRACAGQTILEDPRVLDHVIVDRDDLHVVLQWHAPPSGTDAMPRARRPNDSAGQRAAQSNDSPSPVAWRGQGAASSKAAAARMTSLSCRHPPTICRPTGSPPDIPQGTLAAGRPQMLNG